MPYPIQRHTIQVSPYFPGCAGPWRPTSLHLEALWPHQSPSCKFKHFSRVFWGLLYISYHTDSWILLTEYASTASEIPNNVFHFLAKTCIAGLCYWHEKHEIVFFFLAKKENTCCSHSMTWSLNFNLPRELQPLSINPPCYLVERKTCLVLEFETEIFLAEILGNNGQENNTEKSKSGKISNVMSNQNELLPSRWFMLMSVLMRTIMSIIRIAHLSSSSIRKSVEVLVEVWHRRAFVSPPLVVHHHHRC